MDSHWTTPQRADGIAAATAVWRGPGDALTPTSHRTIFGLDPSYMSGRDSLFALVVHLKYLFATNLNSGVRTCLYPPLEKGSSLVWKEGNL